MTKIKDATKKLAPRAAAELPFCFLNVCVLDFVCRMCLSVSTCDFVVCCDDDYLQGWPEIARHLLWSMGALMVSYVFSSLLNKRVAGMSDLDPVKVGIQQVCVRKSVCVCILFSKLMFRYKTSFLSASFCACKCVISLYLDTRCGISYLPFLVSPFPLYLYPIHIYIYAHIHANM